MLCVGVRLIWTPGLPAACQMPAWINTEASCSLPPVVAGSEVNRLALSLGPRWEAGDLHTGDVHARVHLERERCCREGLRSAPDRLRHKFRGFYFANAVDVSVKTESRKRPGKEITLFEECVVMEGEEQKAGGKRGKNEICGTWNSANLTYNKQNYTRCHLNYGCPL